MPRGKKIDLKVKELSLEDARREFSRRRTRGSKYDQLLAAVEKLAPGKALLIEQASYSEVLSLRRRVKELVAGNVAVESVKVDKEQNLYDVLIHRK